MTGDRAKIHVTDVIVGAAVTIVSLGLAPVYYDLIERISAEAGPFESLLLELVVPFLFIGIIISLGVSAQRRV